MLHSASKNRPLSDVFTVNGPLCTADVQKSCANSTLSPLFRPTPRTDTLCFWPTMPTDMPIACTSFITTDVFGITRGVLCASHARHTYSSEKLKSVMRKMNRSTLRNAAATVSCAHVAVDDRNTRISLFATRG